ncbi:hypothetical protein SRB5_02870 [Streptomyces sp. RB5]|uniref:DUF4246 domain-containing protein n=1 Tax=Streptomyces smaragdinus TaxID=2585196 RepID=A0A7K0C9Q1_9ACTN|nr:hypothetical protein [Streptomyces smaragdinus]
MTEQTPFPLPFDSAQNGPLAPVRSLRERRMTECSAAVRAKPEWFDKLRDPEIRGRWTSEALAQGLTRAQIEYVLAELEHYAGLRDADSGIEVSCTDGVWHSDSLIPDVLRDRLRDAVRVLEDVPEEAKDWHPGSDEQVLDLVHPSLFCLVNGVSPAPPETWVSPARPYARYEFSSKFQWLPADVTVDADGSAAFTSYVNNVHPQEHADLAAVLPDLFSRMVPLWERVLTDLRHPRPLRIDYDPWGWYSQRPTGPREADFDSAEAFRDAKAEWYRALDTWYETRTPAVPDAPAFTPPEPPAERVSLRGRDLQVIVKLADIHLTPESPEYAGGSWHVEGMLNERIVSTGIYYWDSDNITDSSLAFRAVLDDPDYQQNDDTGVREVYGLEDEEPLNADLGSTPTPAGRCLAFPNILQHRVSPFRLTDPTRPGHRKILAFFLIDPSTRITSTADVPPQQPWAATSTMTLDEAKGHREELMKERKFFTKEHNEELYEREFSLCEH